jgi:hypothetical protein
MSYKVLMAHLDSDDDRDERMSLAAELAGRFDAALIGVSAWAPRPAFAVDSAVIESVPDIADLQVMEDLLKARGERFRAVAGTAVNVADNVLTIRGEKKAEKEEKGKNYQLVERSYGAFARTVELPDGVDPDAIKASIAKGVLKVTVPKPAPAKAKKVEIKTAA